jgi:hypothetical protein
MAITATNIEWFYNPTSYWREYGVWKTADNVWAVVRTESVHPLPRDAEFKILTTVSDRRTAIGFIKLLTEK